MRISNVFHKYLARIAELIRANRGRESSDEYSASVTKTSPSASPSPRSEAKTSERAATWLACANSNFALARLISRRSEKPAINLRIHYHKLARRSLHGWCWRAASSSHRATTRMTDQSGDEEGVRFARLRRQARRKNVVLLVPLLFFFRSSRPPHMYELTIRFMDPRTGPSIN